MKHLKLLAAAGLLILAGAGCKKVTYDPPAAISAISVYNASPDAPKLSFYLDANKLQYDSTAYKSYVDYVNAYSGSREISAYKSGTKKFAKTVKLDEGKIYSAYLTGNYATAEFVLLEDSLARPATGKANIRLVNMSIGSPSLDLSTSGATAAIISGRTYKSNSSFTSVDGNKQYSFVVRENGSAVDKAVIPSVTLTAGHNYTIWTWGIYGSTDGPAFGAAIVLNY